MSLEQLIEVYDRILSDFDPIMIDEVTHVAEDGLALVDRRITRQGVDANNVKFPDYSPGYKLHKQREGKYRGIVDLQFTGQMWKGIQVVSKEVDGPTVKVTIAGTTPQTKAKMENNAALRGDFLTLSDAEVEILITDSRERLFTTFNGYFE
jgi:hypothetical protein